MKSQTLVSRTKYVCTKGQSQFQLWVIPEVHVPYLELHSFYEKVYIVSTY